MMYTRQESSHLRQEFWIRFGQYMAPVPSAEGGKVNWINYKTGVRFISFRMNASSTDAYFAIEISHPEAAQRHQFFDHFQTFRAELEEELGGSLLWEKDKIKESGASISSISSEIKNINIYQKESWPAIISFFKNCITGTDIFWARNKEIFQMLS